MQDEINYMDWHNTRALNYIPDHFVRVKFNHNEKRNDVMEWLQRNATGRFGIEQAEKVTSTNFFSSLNQEMVIGFENPADATMYTMFYR